MMPKRLDKDRPVNIIIGKTGHNSAAQSQGKQHLSDDEREKEK